MATFVFIESNTTGTGQLLARKALNKGFRVLFLSRDPARYPFLVEEMIHPVVLDTHDKEVVSAFLRGINDLVGVFSSSEYFLETAAHVARVFDLHGADPAAISGCRDKWRLAQQLEQHDIPRPRTVQVSTIEEANAIFEEWGPPLVVKPILGSGSIGVQKHSSAASFQVHVQELLTRTTNERGQEVAPRVLLQSYLEGDEFSVEIIGRGSGHEVLGITRKYLGDPPFFVEVGHDFPADLPQSSHDAIVTLVKRALDAVGLNFGPSHSEVRFDGEQAFLIEINPRLAGGMIPVLIEAALEVDLLDAIIDLYAGNPNMLAVSCCSAAASIGFLIPPGPGLLKRVSYQPNEHVLQLACSKKIGERLVQMGDFRDRIGYVIMTGNSPQESRARLDAYLGNGHIEVSADATAEASENTGRLKKTLHPEALAIIRKPPPQVRLQRELLFLTAVDQAHLLMLCERQILSREQVRPILAEIGELKRCHFEVFKDKIAPRGTYLLYENELIERLGIELGGVTHTGRSRNDINSCLFRLDLRERFEVVYRKLWRLRSALVCRAESSSELVMPIYSQFQPGLPGSLAYYLLSVEEALARDQEALRQILPALNTSPMGAGAGAGTSFAIDPLRTAGFLGFETCCNSALDAVASRDLALRLLAAVAISGMHISRIAQDFQLWSTLEFGFLELPDDLAGGSSMMPQKKNPYLLEMIKGRAIAPSGQWSASIAGMQKVPFSNSVEVGTEALVGLEKALSSYGEAATLMSLIVTNARANPEKMIKSAEQGVVIAACVSDWLVRSRGLAFREAHHQVGAAISHALDTNRDPNQALLELVPEAGHDLATWAASFDHGGGPGPKTTDANSDRARQRLADDADWLRKCTDLWSRAEQKREAAVGLLLGSACV